MRSLLVSSTPSTFNSVSHSHTFIPSCKISSKSAVSALTLRQGTADLLFGCDFVSTRHVTLTLHASIARATCLHKKPTTLGKTETKLCMKLIDTHVPMATEHPVSQAIVQRKTLNQNLNQVGIETDLLMEAIIRLQEKEHGVKTHQWTTTWNQKNGSSPQT